MDDATLEAIQYLVAECNYGGRITDTHDRRLLATILKRLVNLKVAIEDGTDLTAVPGKLVWVGFGFEPGFSPFGFSGFRVIFDHINRCNVSIFFSGLYQVPTDLERSRIIDQVIDMHSVPFPEGMGLSENSATVRDLRDSKRLLHGVLLTQPGVAELVSWAREKKSLLDYAPTYLVGFVNEKRWGGKF